MIKQSRSSQYDWVLLHSRSRAKNHPILKCLSGKALRLRIAPGDSFAIPEPYRTVALSRPNNLRKKLRPGNPTTGSPHQVMRHRTRSSLTRTGCVYASNFFMIHLCKRKPSNQCGWFASAGQTTLTRLANEETFRAKLHKGPRA
jgi:hypothetical protein